jgi:arginase
LIDAHADILHTSPSGNIHGMPLSAALGEDNFDCQVNEINPDTAQRWKILRILVFMALK